MINRIFRSPFSHKDRLRKFWLLVPSATLNI